MESGFGFVVLVRARLRWFISGANEIEELVRLSRSSNIVWSSWRVAVDGLEFDFSFGVSVSILG